MELPLVVAEVASKLDGVKRRERGMMMFVDARLRGCEVEIQFRRQPGSGAADWTVTASTLGAPLLLRARLTGVRGPATLSTGDAAFDRAWAVEAAPPSVAAEVLDVGVREAITSLGPSSGTPPAFFLFGGDGIAAAVEVADGKVIARRTYVGAFEAAEVLAGLEVVVRIHERLQELALVREATEVSPEARQIEQDAMAALLLSWKPRWVRSPLVRVVVIVMISVAVIAECAIELRDCVH